MKASDYIVEYLIGKGITNVFGYPGGMVTHLMDSFSKYEDKIKAHVMYHEQGASMAACGYAQTSGIPGVAYATSGPGATNMITGICNAYMDSIPTIFITGQVNSFEQRGELNVRQRGFQETDIVSMVSGITKYAARVNDAEKLKWHLDYAFYIANEGRKGPVLLDIAMDVTRANIEPDSIEGYEKFAEKKNLQQNELAQIERLIKEAKKPVFLLGNGLLKNARRENEWLLLLNESGIPVVSSMLAVDIKSRLKNYYGFIGAYGDRTANFVVAKSDLVIAIGARMDVRQVGAKRENFAPKSKLIRIDIDKAELEYKVHEVDEFGFCADAEDAFFAILKIWSEQKKCCDQWIETCNEINNKLAGVDDRLNNHMIREISKLIPDNTVITTDVGQNQVWVAQSFEAKASQKILFSGGHGAMGYSLPAAIGACLASGNKVYSFNGDGGVQMNLQELQVLAREQLPVKVVIFNNNALGMIRHFQEMYFNDNYFQTVPLGGFDSPSFERVAKAYRLDYEKIEKLEEIKNLKNVLNNDKPAIIEVKLSDKTYVFPKLEFGKPNQDQEPLLDRNLYHYLNCLGE